MAVQRHVLFGKLTPTLFKSIESATAFCKLRSNPYVELVHWVNQLHLQVDNDWHRIIRHFKINTEVLARDLAVALNALPNGATSIFDFSHHIELAIERGWILATLNAGDNKIRGAWLFAAILETPELRRVLLSMSSTFSAIPFQNLVDSLPTIIQGSPEDTENSHDGSGLCSAVPGDASEAMLSTAGIQSALAKFCTDLTAQARSGQIDPVIGRDHEIRSMIDILLRRRQSNPLLTGEAGVGKTAVVEGLALAIAHRHVPPSLHEVKLLSLDVGALLAGASMKGEFESRLKGVLEEVAKSAQPIILFVDEVHTLIGAGGQAGTGDAANLLKPALARGTLRTIGATTWGEYKKHIEKDPALTRRFQVLQIQEPEEIAAMDMVRGLVDTFSKHHGVWIMDTAVRAAVTLSHRYIPSRQLPDKAISLLDTACARVAMSLHTPPARLAYLRERLVAANVEQALLQQEAGIGRSDAKRQLAIEATIADLASEHAALTERWQTELAQVQALIEKRQALINKSEAQNKQATRSDDDNGMFEFARLEEMLQQLQQDAPLTYAQVDDSVVAAIVSDWTGIPVGRMVKDETTIVIELPKTLEERVIGQSRALEMVGERIQVARAQLIDPNKPIGVFLLVGPSGVGKTETALALSEALYGGEQNLISVNMSEFQEAHTISTLKGSPPGYVGYGEGGVLTESVRRRPYSVVLLDEIEKAHPDVHEMFYQVFDKGWMEDGEGRYIDFKNTVILLTSNVGSDLISSLCDDEHVMPSHEALLAALQPELRKVFPAAFLGRLNIIPYLPLARDNLAHIVRLHLQKVVKRMQANHGITLVFTDSAINYIVAQCDVHETGARLLLSFIEQKILPRLSRYWLDAITTKQAIQRIVVSQNAVDATSPIDPNLAGGLLYTMTNEFQLVGN